MCFTIITTDSFVRERDGAMPNTYGGDWFFTGLRKITNSFHRIASSVVRLQWKLILYSALSLPILIGGKTTFTPYYDFYIIAR